MKEHLVSIIIPIFNAEKTISKCIDSIVNQTYKNIEILLINDGSTDSTLNIIQSFVKKDKRLKIINKNNTGVSDSRNVGIKKAKGQYLMFIDADDYLELNAIELLYKKSLKNDVDIIRFNGYIEKNNGNYKKLEFPISNNKIIFSNNTYEIMDIINNPKCSIRCYSPLLFMKNNNIIKFKTDINYLEDKIFYLDNFINNKKILFINEPLYYYTFNPNSKTKNTEKYYQNILDILKSKEYIKEKAQELAYDLSIIDNSYLLLILYRLDFLIKTTNYKKCKDILNKVTIIISNDQKNIKYFNIIKKIQFRLLVKKLFLSYYLISSIKNIVSDLIK